MIDWKTVGMVAVIAFSAVFFTARAVGVVLLIRDTARRKGRWGINAALSNCPECGEPAPVVRAPANLRQALWGGHTCAECGCEFDKWGEPVDDGPRPADEQLRGNPDA